MKSILNHLIYITILALAITTTSCEKDIAGCTDPSSETYNPEATIDDGNCVYSGCTDPTSETYNPRANKDDGSCQFKGCTDSNSINYNPQATINDGSCKYERDAFLGKYKATEKCESGDYEWDMEIVPSSSGINKVTLKNLGDYEENVPATVSGNQITFNYNSGIIIIRGNGQLTGNTLKITYYAEIGFIEYHDNCTVDAIKR